jgi:large subunit ribosomal protein L6
MSQAEASVILEIPSDVEMCVDGKVVEVKGEKGIQTRDFSHSPTLIEVLDGKIRIWLEWPSKKEAALTGTIASHIQNMINGVRQGFTYKLKLVFSHFPISVRINGNKLLIDNFTGERSSRTVKIQGNTKVTLKGDDIIVQGINIEDVTQTVANIEQATKVKNKDPRVFLDGIYLYEKKEGME